MSKHVVVGDNGDPCPRCGQPTQVREHKAITECELRRPFYYSRWFYCTNRKCKTSLVMPAKFQVWNQNTAGDELRRLAAIKEQLSPPA